MARRDYAIICVVTRMKFHVIIHTIITRQKRVTKAIMQKNARNSAYFRRKRTLRVQSQFVSVRVCSLSFDRRCCLSWKQARKKSRLHFVPFIPVANLLISLVKSNSEIFIYSFAAISIAAYGTDGG